MHPDRSNSRDQGVPALRRVQSRLTLPAFGAVALLSTPFGVIDIDALLRAAGLPHDLPPVTDPAPHDPGGPAAPAGLSAIVADGRIHLDWTESTDPVSGYRLHRNGAVLVELPPEVTEYADASVEPGTLYSYHVTAVGPGGVGPASATVIIGLGDPGSSTQGTS